MSKKKKLPEGWTMQNLGDVLGDVHGPKFVEIWNRLQGDMTAVQREFREYLQPFKKEFRTKGFNVDFLSYAVPFHMAEKFRADRETQVAHDTSDIADQIIREHQQKRKPNQWN